MSAAVVLTETRARGIIVLAHGERLRCHGPEAALTPTLLARLTAVKPEILDLLRREEDEIAWRAAAMRHGCDAAGNPPATISPLTPAGGDRCRCWGAPTLDDSPPRCPLCALAAVRILEERRVRTEGEIA